MEDKVLAGLMRVESGRGGQQAGFGTSRANGPAHLNPVPPLPLNCDL